MGSPGPKCMPTRRALSIRGAPVWLEDRMTFPILPTMMAVEELPKDISLCDAAFRSLDRCIDKAHGSHKGSQETR